jgi:hypothetical protein
MRKAIINRVRMRSTRLAQRSSSFDHSNAVWDSQQIDDAMIGCNCQVESGWFGVRKFLVGLRAAWFGWRAEQPNVLQQVLMLEVELQAQRSGEEIRWRTRNRMGRRCRA